MDREQVMALAKDAGLPTAWISETGVLTWFDLEHFATLAIAYEREECAALLQANADACEPGSMLQVYLASNAAAIRSRT